MGYYKQKTSAIEWDWVCNACLIVKWKGWEGGFISENIEFDFQKSQLTIYLPFLVIVFFSLF